MPFVNPYADRLREFSSFTFNEPDIARFGKPGAWRDFFQSRMDGPAERLVLEVGCSHGVFLSDVAGLHRNTAFVGVDWKFKPLYRAAKRMDECGLRNVALLRCRAQQLPKIFAAGDLDELWVFFPDPWAKKPQLKHRLLQESFLMDAFVALKPGARVLMKTDHPGYFQWVLALFGAPEPELPAYSASVPAEPSYRARQIKVRRVERDTLPGPSDAIRSAYELVRFSTDFWGERERPSNLFGELQTQFEKTFVNEGLPIYYLELRRR